jgi:hypothetical protein
MRRILCFFNRHKWSAWSPVYKDPAGYNVRKRYCIYCNKDREVFAWLVP